jgi:hypothetical protein
VTLQAPKLRSMPFELTLPSTDGLNLLLLFLGDLATLMAMSRNRDPSMVMK